MTQNQEHHLRSSEEDDLIYRSTKKIKEDDIHVIDVEVISGKEDNPRIQEPEPKASYRDKVMETETSFDLQRAEIVRVVTEELFPDIDLAKSSDHVHKEFNPNPTVKVELEEYENWCTPWKFSLIVRLMGNVWVLDS
ncbi:hypothetical protein SESBI_49803 [Sesbania bispinosa]|nr:hypothetical protein SESBI_49803 [Sesbania bispinosa]